MDNHIDWDYAEIAKKAAQAGYKMPTLKSEPEKFICYMNDLREVMGSVSQVFKKHCL